MIRKIAEICEEKCSGCGLCAKACHEGAIAMIDGKAKLIKDDYCDGLGDCLPACPAGAITIVEREAAAYDEAAVKQRMAAVRPASGGCPGSAPRTFAEHTDDMQSHPPMQSKLRQWPVQIQLAPVSAPYFAGAELLIAADCAAYAYAGIHGDFMDGRVTLIGCPKLDPVDYAEKLSGIFARNAIAGVTVLRMEVPCCGGLTYAVRQALNTAGREIPYREVTLSLQGEILHEEV